MAGFFYNINGITYQPFYTSKLGIMAFSLQVRNKIMAGAVAIITASGTIWGANLKMGHEEQKVGCSKFLLHLIYIQLR